MAIAFLPVLFSLLGLPCRSSLLSAIFILAAIFYHAIFIVAIHFIAVQPAISQLFIQGWTLSCRFCSGPVVAIFILLLKMFSFRLQVAAPIFFVAFLVVVLLVIFTPSCCSYCHCSTGSNSHTVLLSSLHLTLQHCSLFQ